MRRPRPGVGSELLPVLLILAGLAGTLGLVIAMHRRVVATRPALAARPTPPTFMPASEPIKTPPPLQPLPSAQPAPAVEDPTKQALAALEAQEADERRAAGAADRKADALEAARQAAVATSLSARRRDALVHAQIDAIDAKAQRIEEEADALAKERDVLAQERDATKAAVVKARARGGGYAVLPHKSPNGTWQRPVMIECRNGTAILQPQGIAFSMIDMSPLLDARSSPLVMAVARELIRAHRTASPDGSSVIPYIYFIVRPDGVRPYYEARARLEPLGIAFGYELVEQDWDIDFPDFDDLDTWDGSGKPRSQGKDLAGGPGGVASANGFVWPVDRDAPANRGGQPGAISGSASLDGGQGDGRSPFIWPTRPPGGGGGGGRGDELPDLPRARDLAAKGSAPPGGSSRTARMRSAGSPSGALEPFGQAGGSGGFGGGEPVPRPSAGSPGQGGSRAMGEGSDPGLVPLGPGGLPGLDPPGSASGGDPLPGFGAGSGNPMRPGGRFAGAGVNSPGGGLGTPGTTSGSIGSIGQPPAGGPSAGTATPGTGGRVRIDRSLLAQATQDDDPFDRPPALPMNRMASGSGSGSGTGSSGSGSPSTDSSSSGPAGGQPPIGVGTPSSRGGMSGMAGIGTPSFGGETSPPDSKASRDTHPRPRRPAVKPRPEIRPIAVEVPLQMVVACGPDGVVVHPGGYRISQNALKKDRILQHDLETIVRNHELIDPMVRPKPRVEFLIEPGGSETFQAARRQTVLSGPSWPVTIKVSEANAPRVFSKERF